MKVHVIRAAACASFAFALCAASTASAEPRTHDGFYFQGGVGVGYLNASADHGGGFKESIYGVTTPISILLGGTVGPVVIGGGFFADHATSPGAKVETPGFSASGSLTDVTMTLIGLGVFADYYVDPHGGLHFQPFVGWGGLERSYRGDSGGSDPTGLVMALGGGYDWWVGDEWSIGVMGRVAYAPLKFNDVSVPTVAPAILATFTYH